jgi:hypothetical protein
MSGQLPIGWIQDALTERGEPVARKELEMRTNRLKTLGLRLALIPVLSVLALGVLAANPRGADAATVGDCYSVSDLRPNGTAHGKIRWAGSAQCFAIYLKGGYSYTFTTEVGPHSDAYSTNPLSYLGDSVMQLWAQKDGTFLFPSYDASQFNFVTANDDYNAPTTYASQINFTAPGEFGVEKLYIIRVSGYGNAIGRYWVNAGEYLVATPSPCYMYYGC